MTALHPDAFAHELRTLCDHAFERPSGEINPLRALIAGELSRADAAAYLASRWDALLLHNELEVNRLMEGCPDISGRADVWRVIFPEWGKGRLEHTEPYLYRTVLVALGATVDADPQLDRAKPEVAAAIERFENLEWFAVLGDAIGHEVLAPVVFPAIEAALASCYGLDAGTLAFFTNRAQQDREHAEILFALAARLATTWEAQDAVRAGLAAHLARDPHAYCAVAAAEYSFVEKSHALTAVGRKGARKRGSKRGVHDNRFDIITFDCYGTLIDWERGVADAFADAASHDAHEIDPALATRTFREVDRALKREGKHPHYRDLLVEAARITGDRLGWKVPAGQLAFLVESVADWQPFPDTNDALRRLVERGYRLGLLSNVDDELLEGSLRRLDAPFELVITSEQVGSYKPAPGHFRAARAAIGDRRWLHAGRGLSTDVLPAQAHGVPAAWIHRGDLDVLEQPAGCASFATVAELADWFGRDAVESAA